MNPKVFISYSWSNPAHSEWVVSLAERLMQNGVNVVLDKWDLKEGHDKFSFMESMVTSPDVQKVLIILDEKYATKADGREGGVGTETLIIGPNVYENVAQEKFIPIVTDFDEEGNPFIPTYLKGRIYIDLSDKDASFESNYEKLLRNIFDRPSYPKPRLGKMPDYLVEDSPVRFTTTLLIRSFDAQIERNPNRINSFSRDFFEKYLENLEDFRIKNFTHSEIDNGNKIFDNLNQYTPLRDDYIRFISKISKLDSNFDIDLLIGFFENLTLLLKKEGGGYFGTEFDNFKFIIQEMFIYTISVFLKYGKYDYLQAIFFTLYFTKNSYNNEPVPYVIFNFRIASIDEYYNKLKGTNYISAQADFMIGRLPKGFEKETFIEGDLFCYYIGLFQSKHWFPSTYVYWNNDLGYSNKSFNFFNRLVSLKHFEKVKQLFNVETVEELKKLLLNLKEKDENSERPRYLNSWDRVTSLHDLISVDRIGVSR